MAIRVLSLLALLLTAGTASAQTPLRYRATPLGLFGQHTYGSSGTGISDTGLVTGFSDTGVPNEQHAVLHDGTSLVDLGTFGGPSSEAYGVNQRGWVVGAARNASDIDRAFVYRDGRMEDLGDLGGAYSAAYAISSNGVVTGVSQTAGGLFRPFLLRNGVMTQVPLPNAFDYGIGFGVNSRGQVAGYMAAGSDVRAFVFDGSLSHDLGTFGGPRSYAAAINEAGHVAGYADLPDGTPRAFLFNGSQMLDLGSLGGESQASGLNDRDEAVGYYQVAPGSFYERAFIYSRGAMLDLTSLVTTGLDGAVLYHAWSINNKGQIVASGCSDGGKPGMALGGICQMYRLDPEP